jgi:hypothetical protein
MTQEEAAKRLGDVRRMHDLRQSLSDE